MPPVVAAVAAAAASVSAVMSIAVIGSITVGNLITAAYVVGSAVEGRRRAKSAAAAARQAYFASLQDRSVMIRSAIAPRNLVYGYDKVSGPMVDAFTTGANGQYLHLIVALAGRAVQGIPTVYLNEFPIEAGQIDVDGNVTGAQWGKTTTHSAEHDAVVAGDGTVTLPQAASGIVMVGIGEFIETYWNYGTVGTGWAHAPYTATISGLTPGAHVRVTYQWQTTASRLRIHKFLGDHTSIPAGLLAETDGRRTAAHVGHGVAHLWVRLEWDQEVWGQIGVPQISALVQGHRVWDPRTSTTAWSENAALCTADYARDEPMGLGCTASQVPDDELAAEANICDEAVPLDAGGTTTQARYTCRGTLSAADSRLSNLDSLLSAMAGSAMWLQGRWRIRAGAHPTPEPITLTVDHLGATPPQLRKSAPRRELFNSVTASYRDPASNYSEVAAPQFPPDGVGPYVAQDGGRRVNQQVQLTMVHDAVRAQRLAKIMLERARQAEAVTIETNARGYNLAPGQVVPVTIARYGWTNKLMEVRQRELNIATGTVRYLLRATAAEVWDWAHGEATLVDPAPDTQLPSPFTAPPAPANLALTTGNATLLRLTDGTLVARVRATWDATAAPFVASGGRIELQWRLQATEAWTSEQPLPGDATEHTIGPLDEGLPIIVRVRAVNSAGRPSAWAWAAITVVGKDAPPSNVTGLTSSVAAGVIPWVWDNCPDIDYQATEVRATDADWGSDTSPPLWRGRVSEWLETVTATGTYTRHVRHLDTGGRPSAATATRAQVVGSGDLGGDAAAQPALVLTPALATIQADADGIVPSWAGTQTVATVVLPDGSDDTAGWTFTKADQGVVSTIAGNVVTVTGWDTASGAVDPYWSQTLFLARFNGALTEERRGRRLGYLLQDDTAPDWVTDSGDTWLQLGNSTGATAGTNWGVVQVEPTTDLLAETGDMVIEGRWRMESIPSRPRTLIALVDATGAEIYRIGWDVGGQHQMTVRTAAGATASQYGGPSVTAGTEYHVAMVRVGNVHTIIVNGVAAGTTITTSYRHPAGARWVVMAASSTGAGAYNDYGFVRLGWARITAGTHRGYTSTFTPAVNPPLGYLTQAAVEVTGTKAGQELVRRFEVLTQRAAYGGEEAATGTLSRDLIALPADWAGTVASYTGATTTLSIRRGAVDITHLYTLSRTNGANVSSSLSGATLSITSLTADASTATITATRAGYPTITATVQVTRSRTPQPVVNVSGPASVVVAGDTAGTVPSASLPVAVAVTASDAGTDVTSSYTWAVSASAGITLSSTTAASTTITAMSSGTDSGSITWTGTRAGWPTLSWRASVSKTRLLLPSGAIVASLPAISIFDNASAATVGLRLTSDGRVQVYRQNATGAWVTVANFYNPTTTSIGSGYRVRLLGTPSGSTSGTWNAWQALSSDVTWQAGSEVGGGVGSHGWTLHQIQIAATGSTDILATYLVTGTAIVEGS